MLIKANDSLTGGTGADVLVGGNGRDTLIGGSGADHFHIALTEGFDNLQDFKSGEDQLVISADDFGLGLDGALPTELFRVGGRALTEEQRFIYNRGSGSLLYDADGNGSGAAVVIARLITQPTLTASDILVTGGR